MDHQGRKSKRRREGDPELNPEACQHVQGAKEPAGKGSGIEKLGNYSAMIAKRRECFKNWMVTSTKCPKGEDRKEQEMHIG